MDEPLPLAGGSTLNRLERAPNEGKTARSHKIGQEAEAIGQLFADLFLAARVRACFQRLRRK